MKLYKVYTKWIGYSEIEVEGKSEEEAKQKVLEGDYDLFNEASTGGDLDYGFEDEKVLILDQHWSDTDGIDVMAIPRDWCQTIDILREKECTSENSESPQE